MNIAVFGDSFATQHWQSVTWWQQLANHGHTVKSYGANGSSIFYSAKVLEEVNGHFDFLIWCLTTPGRYSFQNSQLEWIHASPTKKIDESRLDAESLKKIKSWQEYSKWCYDINDDNMIGLAVANHYLSQYKNLMIIPCFHAPLKEEFYLFKLSQFELQHFFSESELSNLFQNYMDMRNAHLTPSNHIILGDILANNLNPGIFQTNYDNFSPFKGQLTSVLQKL